MLDVDLKMGNNSIVKFGGYDESQVDGELNVFNTKQNSYDLTNPASIFWGNSPLPSRNIRFTPDYPFMYVGSEDYKTL
jgi:hypothetical protein